MESNTSTNLPSSSTVRGRLTRQQAEALLSAWQRSGEVSLAAFARERGLDVKRLYSWRQRLEQSADSGMGLAQVRFAAKVVRESVGVVVVLPNGIRVELPTDWDASAVAAFCEVLRC